LVERARARRLDVILDPRTQPSATIGGFNDSLGELPWGRSRPHTEEDFRGASGRRITISLARFALEHAYTQVLTPSHFLRSTADEWLDIDRRSTLELAAELERTGAPDVSLIYSLAITYTMLRDQAERRVLIRSLKDLPIEGIWLSVDGVGSHSTPAAVRTYLDAVSDFHVLGLPIVADHVGGIVGLGLLAFGGVGGLSHGITYGERFDTGAWLAPRGSESFGLSRRVYVPALDMLLKPKEAEMLFAFGPRAKALFGCHDSTCCRRGVPDMQAYPAQHFMRQRIDEIANLSLATPNLRPGRFVDKHLRSPTDAMLAAAQLDWPDPKLGARVSAQRKRMDRMRVALGNLAETGLSNRSVAAVPLRNIERSGPSRPPMTP
jgi:hypothetical protein